MRQKRTRTRGPAGAALTTMLVVLVSGCVSAGPTMVATSDERPSSSDASGDSHGLEKHEGLLTLYTEAGTGRVWLEVADLPPQLLYVEGLRSGLGSNPVGLDRGELGDSRLIEIQRVGDRLLLVQPNLRYRADSGSEAEETAVGESFARSILWAGSIDRDRIAGVELVDLTPFLLRDVHDIVGRLKETGQGSFKLDRERSLVDLESCLAFPDNIEIEALLTFSGDEAGPLVREATPEPSAITLVQHHSLIRLPDDGYQPRAFDPRAGSFPIQYADYSAGLGDTIERRWIVRHRLQKENPTAERSLAVEPIVYYIDPAIPEPIRQAVLEGAGWWSEAFTAAGFEDAFRVELLPADAHPLDVRYNVVQWVHRSTRGWSYGGGIIDPRTGEMLKGHVRLGSLRVRQDRLLFEGLAGVARTGSGQPDDPVELALARIRQLAAHEVGHTLGLDHNFAASTYGDRASVMDYPAPLVRVDAEESLDFSDAYGVGVGAWDIHAIRYAHTEFPEGADEALELERIVLEGLARNLIFLGDQDARPAGAAQPLANLWDNGSDPIDQLELEIEVRRVALERFGQGNVKPGTPLALLEEVLVPLYLHHRYQLTAAVKMVGGVDYRYKLRGDPQPLARPIAPEAQRRALAVVLRTLEPGFLDLSDSVLELLLPRPAGYSSHRELFATQTAPVFDPLAVAGTAAAATLDGLLQPQRAARMVDFHRRDPAWPDFREVLTAIEEQVFSNPHASERLRAIQRRVQAVFVAQLIELEANPGASSEVRARAEEALVRIGDLLAAPAAAGTEAAHLKATIERYLDRSITAAAAVSATAPMPPGQPIGGAQSPAGWSACSW